MTLAPRAGTAVALLAAALLALPAAAAQLPPTAKAIVDGFATSTDRAVEAAEKGVAAAPTDPATLLWAGRAFGQKAAEASVFSKMSWAKKCRTTWEKAVELDPANVEVRRELIRYYVMAPGIAGGGNEKAEAQVARIAALDPVRGELARGFYLELVKKPAEAEAAYRRAVTLDPKGIDAAISLGSVLASQKRWGEARALFEARLAVNPDDRLAVYQLGRLSAVSGEELEKGLTSLDRYLASPAPEDGPTWADARWRRGQVLEKLGKTPDAIAEYREALKLNPAHRQSRRELERLKAS